VTDEKERDAKNMVHSREGIYGARKSISCFISNFTHKKKEEEERKCFQSSLPVSAGARFVFALTSV